MTITDHLRAVLAIQNPKHFRSPAEQDVLEAARQALEAAAPPQAPTVADQREAFLAALEMP